MPTAFRRFQWSLLTTVTIAMANSNLSAQDSFQVILDTLTGMDRAAILADGSIAVAMSGPDKNMIWIGDGNGVTQSCFSVPATLVPHAFEIIADPDGGLYIASIAAVSGMDMDPFTLDTASIQVRIMSVSTTGQVFFSKDIMLVSYVFNDIWNLTERFHLAADASGLFISMSDGLSISEQNWYLKVSPTGDLLWCKLQEGVFSEPGVPEFDVSPSGDGGVYFALTNIGGAANGMTIGKLDAQGEPEWVEHFAYQNNVTNLEVNDIMTTSTGRPIGAGTLGGVGFSYGYLLSPTADGMGVSGHLYDLPAETDKAFHSIHQLPNGDFFAITRGVGDSYQNLGILHIGPDMEVISALRTEVVPSGQNDNWIRPEIIGDIGGKAVVPGSLRSVDQVFGYIQQRPAIWKMDVPTSDACLVSEAIVPHITVPDSLLAIEPILSFTLTAFDPLVEDSPLSTTPEALITTSDLCSFLVGTPERTSKSQTLDVYPNPSVPGGTLNLHCDDARRFTVYTSTGTVLRKLPTSKGPITSFSCEGLAAGLYPVVAFDADGGRLATGKLEIR